jgi:hypothetical protein
MEHFGQPISNVVAYPVGDQVIGAHVMVQSHVLPLVEVGSVPPPVIPHCCDRHVIRTETHVTIIEVQAKMSAFPRAISHAAVEECARVSILEALEADDVTPTPAAYARGLRAMTQRIANRMRQYGVKIT